MKKQKESIFNLGVLDAFVTTSILLVACIFSSIVFLTMLWRNGAILLVFLFIPVLSVILYEFIYLSRQAIIEEQKETERNKKRNSDT